MVKWGRQAILSASIFLLGNLVNTEVYSPIVPKLIVMGWVSFLWFAFSIDNWATSVNNGGVGTQ